MAYSIFTTLTLLTLAQLAIVSQCLPAKQPDRQFEAIRRRGGSSGGGGRPSGGGSRPSKPRPPRPIIAGGSGGVDDDDDDDDDACFPGSGRVNVLGKGFVPMSHIALGDNVYVGNGQYSQVFMFSHRITTGKFRFVRLSTAVRDLTLSEGHFLYTGGKLVATRDVAVGDFLQTERGELERIESIERVWEEGLYNPHTLDGDIIVDGFRTSTYTTTVEPGCAAALLAPVRALYLFSGLDLTGGQLESGAPKFLLRRIPKVGAVA